MLLVPWILGFQGDNPMSSEIASHVGMTGRCYCRICGASTGGSIDKDAPEEIRDAHERERLKTFMKVNSICFTLIEF